MEDDLPLKRKRLEEDQRMLQRILDGADDPTDLPLQLLKDITNDFSEGRKIGQGGSGAVYEKQIRNSVSGEITLANVRERLFCFEYISNGSLDKHITDELRGFEWETRYELIIGIGKGLRYLHEEKRMIHMDLKPENILLDNQNYKYIVPKITDFGLSRPNKNSHTVGQLYGTRGYMAPEYREGSKTTPACDIYSLGAIIRELVTGCMEVPCKDNVLRRWRHRWRKPPTLLQYQQVTRCIEIAGFCRAEKPEARPSILKIISFLGESESTYGQVIPCLDEDDMLRINPLELRLPSELKNEISHSIELTNDTVNCIAFNIQPPSVKYISQPVKGTVQSKSKCYVKITVQPRDAREHDDTDKFIVQSMKWSEGLIEEDITECISRAKAEKVVDEVDLMVVNEPTRPQENCRACLDTSKHPRKRRGDTNTSAEEVPELKKRKIGESSSAMGKLGSSRKAEAACMYKFYPPQSFSRTSPTNTMYLGEEGHRAVDHTRGAMGSLLDKLGKLVTEDYSLDTTIKSDIESFSQDLRKMHRDLPKLKNDYEAKNWVDEVREFAYNIEDMVDNFLVHIVPNSSRRGFKEIMHDSVKLVQNGMTTHRQISDVIREIKANVKTLDKRKEKYNINVKGDVDKAATKAAIDDLRNSAIHEEDKERLVGIKAPREEIIRLLKKHGNVPNEKLRVVSIVGMGGLGKTTLAKAVYDKYKRKRYNPKVFVPMGRNPDVETVLKNIIFEIKEDFNAKGLNVGQLTKKVKELLRNERYLIVIDDVWHSFEWRVIKPAFPENKKGSRVIITTRDHDIALECCHPENDYVYKIKPLSDEDSRRLFLARMFGPGKDHPDTPRKEEISEYLLKKCGGMPLAINSIARHLAGKDEATWEYAWKCLVDMTQGDGLKITKQILDLSYIHLPDDLKTCLLYVCKYPEDREIDKNDLLRQWVAEGFVSAKGQLDAEDVAENNFKALISMCMIEPGKINYNCEVVSCRVHDLILDLIRSKSSQLNFVHVIDGFKDVSGQLRRISVQYSDKNDSIVLETIKGSLSHVRSVSLYRGLLIHDLLVSKYVRVLHLEHPVFSIGAVLDLTCISGLFLLTYLKVACSYTELKLPDKIGQLQQLETIDLNGGVFGKYPSDIASLPRLSHLIFGGHVGLALPDGIGRLKSLRTLEGVSVYQSSVDNIEGLGELTDLRKLEFYSYVIELEKVTNMRTDALHSSICKLSTSLRILDLGQESGDIPYVEGWSRTLFPPGSPIRKLDMSYCKFQRCPKWIGQLHHLYSLSIGVMEVADGLSIVAGLPSLAYFQLYARHELEEEIVVVPGSGAFQTLKHLSFHCPKASLTFEAGAMPKLEKLDILLPYLMTRQFLTVGIEHLPAGTLKEICLIVPSGTTTAMSQLKREFKAHHPSADIVIDFEDDEGYEADDNEEDYYCGEDEEDDEVAYQVNGSQISSQAQANTRKDELTEAQQYSGRMSINTDVPPMADTSVDLAVGSEERQSERTQDLAVWESLHLPSTSPVASSSPSSLNLTIELCSSLDRAEPMANFPVDINNDLFVQRGNSVMLVNALGQYLDLNQAPLDEATDSNSSR
ncbi:disease resistance protein RGA5-like [Triticum dicoccoides]|uniref:disease resistance protein RGA5-like n=1 Tax=Triticum dicoccoides TaxID=85692 RepID=UPI00188F7224|nr:disease resistance protein RGA5-like [Triticum dicoccoides]